VYVIVRLKTEGVGVKANGEDRLLDDFEGRLVFGGNGEEVFKVLDGVSCRIDWEREWTHFCPAISVVGT